MKLIRQAKSIDEYEEIKGMIEEVINDFEECFSRSFNIILCT